MNYCTDCRYFGPEIIDRAHSVEVDGTPTGFHTCEYIKHAGSDNALALRNLLDTNAAVLDGSGYFAALVVRDDFGCINFEWPI